MLAALCRQDHNLAFHSLSLLHSCHYCYLHGRDVMFLLPTLPPFDHHCRCCLHNCCIRLDCDGGDVHRFSSYHCCSCCTLFSLLLLDARLKNERLYYPFCRRALFHWPFSSTSHHDTCRIEEGYHYQNDHDGDGDFVVLTSYHPSC